MEEKQPKKSYFFYMIFSILLISVIIGFYHFYIKKDFYFLIETNCDAQKETCFQRDCSTGQCPPNNFSEYRIFKINAKDYQMCSNDNCLTVCKNDQTKCEETICDQETDTCSVVK
ncbi:MAG: hypothetical protein WCO58_01005 [bacterium]